MASHNIGLPNIIGFLDLDRFPPILFVARIIYLILLQVTEDHYSCNEQCQDLLSGLELDPQQLQFRLVQSEIKILKANIARLFSLCVPDGEQWAKYGWAGRTVEQIMTELAKQEMPNLHPGDVGFVSQLDKMTKEELNK